MQKTSCQTVRGFFIYSEMIEDCQMMLKNCGLILVLLEELSCSIDFSFLYFLLP